MASWPSAWVIFPNNKGLPFAARSLFYPLLKKRIYGLAGDCIDTLCTVSILFGLATSLGLGTQQVNAGMNFAFGVDYSVEVQLLCITVVSMTILGGAGVYLNEVCGHS